ncbi:lymphocyte expansion molecule-like [Xenia sp. Carnegie-2017]|uniref:lymphocyte expansion molecule-like n=1 Tax=Xenia sp. Carnegie-2017 TaxID=2897299 RepID=UPI001F0486E8|nr:lymphocyte expansion molecule-like [Xenia sp. Carnegie-2017]
MSTKSFRGAPFGVQSARFDVSGVHPKSKTPGTLTQVAYDKKATNDISRSLGPGKYNVANGSFSAKVVRERSSGPGWQRAYETMQESKCPHLLYIEEWKKKQTQKKLLGPGTYEIKDFSELLDSKPGSVRGICETRERRFNFLRKNDVPGPGTYGEGGIPSAAIEKKQKRSKSCIGMLESGKSERKLPEVGSHLCPGQYNYKSFSDELTERVVSKRGPYDLFTGSRNKPLTVGHFAAPNRANLGPGQYDIRSFLNELANEHYNRRGRFLKMERFPDHPGNRIYFSTLSQYPRGKIDIGPGSYTPMDLSKPEATKRSVFGSSAGRFNKHAMKYFKASNNPVGPGRYNVDRFYRAQTVNGNSSVFNSKTGKLDLVRDNYMIERIRKTVLPTKERVLMVPIDAV